MHLRIRAQFLKEKSFDHDLWTGQAIDKQITTDSTMAHYWINEFLMADFATTGERGTRSLAFALRSAVNSTKSLQIKEELVASILLAKGMNKKIISASTFGDSFELSNEAKEAIRKQMKSKSYEEQFFFLADEFQKHIKFKSLKLDNGAILTADAYEFDSIFHKQQKINNEVTFSTTGKVVEERIKKTNI